MLIGMEYISVAMLHRVYEDRDLISARTRRIGVVAIAVVAVCMLAVRAYHWIAPDAPSRKAPLRLPEAASNSRGVTRYPYLCTSVVDGDTIVVKSLGSVRLIGIDTPEMNYELGVPQPFALEAREFCERFVLRKTVLLEFDEVKRDRYGRALAYVFVGDTFVNAELIRAGLATAYHFRPNDRYKGEFKQLERDAKRKRRGLWSE